MAGLLGGLHGRGNLQAVFELSTGSLPEVGIPETVGHLGLLARGRGRVAVLKMESESLLFGSGSFLNCGQLADADYF
jgi:hypothetical protein